MAYIKIDIMTNDIKDEVEIQTHDLLQAYRSNKDGPDRKIFIDLPCPLERLRIAVGGTCLEFKLLDQFEIKIVKCPRCGRVDRKRRCLCYSGAEILQMNVSYFMDGVSAKYTEGLLDELLRTVHLAYVGSVESVNGKEATAKVPLHERDPASIKEALARTKEFLRPCQMNNTWLIKKEFRRQVYKWDKTTVKKVVEKVKSGVKVIKTKVVSFFKSAVSCFKKKPTKPMFSTASPQEMEKKRLQGHILFLYKHIDLLLKHSSTEIRAMICYIIGLSTDGSASSDGLEKINFKKEIFKRSEQVLKMDLEEAYEELQGKIEDESKAIRKIFKPEDKQFFEDYREKLVLINFIKAFYNKTRPSRSSRAEKLLKDTQEILYMRNMAIVGNSTHNPNLKVDIEAECIFSGDKLTSFFPRKTHFFKSKTAPMQLQFESEKGRIHKYLYKTNADLTIDLFFNSLTESIYELLGFPHKLYGVLPLSKDSGIIEIVESRTMSDFDTVEEFKHYLFNRQEDFLQLSVLEDNCSFTNSKMGNFLKSLSISILMCYLFEIRDRNSDNVLINSRGIVFHIDYEFTLGNSTVYLAPKIEIPSLISNLIESDTLILEKIVYLVSKYFKTIRNNFHKILIISRKVSLENILPVRQTNFENIFIKKLFLDLTDAEAEMKVLGIVKNSIGSYRIILLEMISKLNKDIR
ncbi:putative phosphatidylinositol 3-kinase VPS34 like protein [Nosema granulosis]|uniref:Phosphatidylinositol 3-kinase VPS34 like protein n=1 Tax=Nosema granulosis TaxID=83296 RepID=A0A9P6H3X9_9MICR|nr:putative phosphatidylinositol 3-kinase VPS34 like protein [Nosema granulosis]